MGPRGRASLLCRVLVGGAAAPAVAADPTASPSTGGTSPLAGTTAFASYALVPLLSDDTAYAGPATPTSLNDVIVGSDVRQMLKDPKVKRTLLRNGFVIVASDLPRFNMAYEGNAYTGTPVFVTTDAAYDAWHLVFDKVLRTVETKRLLPLLRTLVGGMLATARTQATELAGTPLADAADRVVGLLQVAGTLLRLDVGRLGPQTAAELSLITSHDQLATSPLLGTDIDYSLYTPRGHYTRTKALTRYFLAMSVLGQTAFALPGALQNDLSRADASGLRLAALASRTLVGDAALEAAWQRIYEPTAFLVGFADDYTPFELAAAIETTLPGAMADPAPLADDAAIAAVAAELVAGRPVRIDDERPAVRLMGTRFVIDSYVLDQLLAPNVGTLEEPRLLPWRSDHAAALG